MQQNASYSVRSQQASRSELEQLEAEMESLDVSSDQNQVRMEELANCISELDDELGLCETEKEIHEKRQHAAQEALQFMGVPEVYWSMSLTELSEGVRKKISLGRLGGCTII
jgi:ATPase subunit of ABC transporter with duplicated ATPase domains